MFMSLIGTLASSLIGSLFSGGAKENVTKAAANWVEAKAQQDKFKMESELKLKEAKVTAEIKKLEQDTIMYGDADNASINQWRNGYKDELLVLSVVVLLVSMFIPSLQPYVKEGIALLNELPVWIQAIIGGTYISILGMRFILLAPIKTLFGKK